MSAEKSNSAYCYSLEDRIDTAMMRMIKRMEENEKRLDATSWLLSHTMERLHLAEQKVQRQSSQIASLKKELKEVIWLNNLENNM